MTMLDVKYNIKNLISSIYECQKKIILNRRFIRELESEGNDVSKLKSEIEELEQKITDYQKELKKKYQFSY
jgi:polyhydroxyalkanoate synthesis regulator phasin